MCYKWICWLKQKSLKTLEQIISHTEAFETAMRDQDIIPSVSDIAGLWMLLYHQQKQAQSVAWSTATHKYEKTMMETQLQQNACGGYCSHQHGRAGSGDRHVPHGVRYAKQVASKTTSRRSASQSAIRYMEDEKATMDTLIVHMAFNPATNTYKLGNNNSCKEVDATLIPSSPSPDLRQARKYLSRPIHLQHMGLSKRNLVPSRKKVCIIGRFSLVCQGCLPVIFKVGKRTMKQALYIYRKAACIDVGILPPWFPKPITLPPLVTCDAVHPDIQHHKIDPSANKHV